MISKNITTDHIFEQSSHFELREAGKYQKKLLLANDQPLKYAALVTGADLNLTVETTKPGSALELFLLTPIVDAKPSKINVDLRLLHDRCHLDLTIVALAYSNEKTEVSATIYMQPNIQES